MRPILQEEPAGGLLRFLYHTLPGRAVLKVLTLPFLSKMGGAYLSSAISRHRINRFVKKNGIDLSQYLPEDYASFNAFFSRRIRPEQRPLADESKGRILSPSDGKLSIYPIEKGLVLPIKESAYTVASLLQNEVLASRFQNGWAMVLRLTVDDYHRYAYSLSGEKEADVFISGKLHTVRPIALHSRAVFCENARSYSLIHTPLCGDVVQMEVGALLVGKIVNHTPSCVGVKAGEEKGYFAFGGSTIVLLFEEGRFEPDRELVENTRQGVETIVRYGEALGTASYLT